MKKGMYLGFAFAIMLLMSSCASQKVAYTYGMYKTNDWTQYDLRKMDFYLSDDIVIGREVKKRRTRIKNGRVRRVNGKLMEEITIKRGTVGVLAKQINSKELAIEFTDCKNCSLVFKRLSRSDDRFVLKTKGYRRHHKGKVKFNGSTYYASADSKGAHLLIKMKEVDRKVTRKYEVRGRRSR